MYAIWQYLEYVDTNNLDLTVICSDSLSSLQSISDTFNSDPLVENILSTFHWLLCNNQTVIFIWIPSHIGIIGNERADEAAREAANSDYADNIPMRQDNIKVHIKHKILTLWQEKWSEQNTHLRKIKHTTIPEQHTRTLKRRDQVVITRLRIGHTNMTSSYLLLGQHQPSCDHCRVPLTVEHLLQECPVHERDRQSE
ncbi:hypothetical protein JTB14_031999 [Gonioctena quinquepunctata]|nr:hypothetical protein JTB14_031999 [Gonioctena quinquepunctata]